MHLITKVSYCDTSFPFLDCSLWPEQVPTLKTFKIAPQFIQQRKEATRMQWIILQTNLRLRRNFDMYVTFRYIVFLFPFKASVYTRAKDGSTLLHVAALNGHSETAMILHRRGVPLLMPNRYSHFLVRKTAKVTYLVLEKLFHAGKLLLIHHNYSLRFRTFSIHSNELFFLLIMHS